MLGRCRGSGLLIHTVLKILTLFIKKIYSVRKPPSASVQGKIVSKSHPTASPAQYPSHILQLVRHSSKSPAYLGVRAEEEPCLAPRRTPGHKGY